MSVGLLMIAAVFAAPVTFETVPTVAAIDFATFVNPPAESRPECWWWFSEKMSEKAITHDLEAMARVGLTGYYFYGGDRISPQGIAKCRYALRESKRLGLKAGIVIGSAGCGHPSTKDEHLRKELVLTRAEATGPAGVKLARPDGLCYRDIAVVAVGQRNLSGLDVTKWFDRATETLTWPEAPTGKWTAYRFGYVSKLGGTYAKTARSIDHMSRAAFDAHWETTMAPLLKAVTPEEKSVLSGVLCDSWEAGACSWTPGFAEEFVKRRGYDLIPHLPEITLRGKGRPSRVVRDFDLTVADLITENHYAYKKEVANRHGLAAVTEAAGPHQLYGDGRRMQGYADVAMGEFWCVSAHRPGLAQRFMLRDSAMAAHVYGIPTVEAEAFTQVKTHWTVTPHLMKLAADRAFAEGLNRVCYHGFDGAVAGEPPCGSISHAAGIHYNPQATWFELSHPFNDYLARCSWMLAQGRPVADCLLYAGDGKGLLYGMKRPEDGLGFGYDYDVAPTEILLVARVENGEIVLPSKTRYKVLFVSDRNPQSVAEMSAGNRPPRTYRPYRHVLPDEAVRKLAELEKSGATVLRTRKELDAFVASGRLAPDVRVRGAKEGEVDWIHRTAGDTEIYFVANQTESPLSFTAEFRAAKDAASLWDAVTGTRRAVGAGTDAQGSSSREIAISLPSGGSTFVVFGQAAETVSGAPSRRFRHISGPWSVTFDPACGGPHAAEIWTNLIDWTTSPVEGIRYYSGTAVYRTKFSFEPRREGAPETFAACPHAASAPETVIDLGEIADVAEVILNGRNLGIAWTPPYRLPVGDALREGTNELEVRITNRWFNRYVLDESRPKETRITHSLRKPGPDGRLVTKPGDQPFKSGLFGPVTLARQL